MTTFYDFLNILIVELETSFLK